MKYKLIDRADGVKGHYCIGREIPVSTNKFGSFWEFYNKGKWLSAGQVFTNRKNAAFLLGKLVEKGLLAGEEVEVENAAGTQGD